MIGVLLLYWLPVAVVLGLHYLALGKTYTESLQQALPDVMSSNERLQRSMTANPITGTVKFLRELDAADAALVREGEPIDIVQLRSAKQRALVGAAVGLWSTPLVLLLGIYLQTIVPHSHLTTTAVGTVVGGALLGAGLGLIAYWTRVGPIVAPRAAPLWRLPGALLSVAGILWALTLL
jgi:hypothetical protein